jgi:serine/threonine protein kinase
MIHEEGRLQIIDFGVAGTLVNQADKRTTVIGTPHWMGPEVFKGKDGKDKGYGTKVGRIPRSMDI